MLSALGVEAEAGTRLVEPELFRGDEVRWRRDAAGDPFTNSVELEKPSAARLRILSPARRRPGSPAAAVECEGRHWREIVGPIRARAPIFRRTQAKDRFDPVVFLRIVIGRLSAQEEAQIAGSGKKDLVAAGHPRAAELQASILAPVADLLANGVRQCFPPRLADLVEIGAVREKALRPHETIKSGGERRKDRAEVMVRSEEGGFAVAEEPNVLLLQRVALPFRTHDLIPPSSSSSMARKRATRSASTFLAMKNGARMRPDCAAGSALSSPCDRRHRSHCGHSRSSRIGESPRSCSAKA